jgi:hypothetical protein
MNRPRGLTATIVLLLILAACSSPGEGEQAGVSGEAAAYLVSVGEIQARVDDGFDGVEDVLGRSYPTREVLITAIRDAGYEGLAATAASLAEELTPPVEHAADHEAWIAHRRLAREVAREVSAAAEADDLQEMFRVFTVLAQDWAALLDGATREFCLEVAEGPMLCPAPDDLPGGEYGRSVYDTLRHSTYSTFGLFDFFEDMSPEERSLRLEEVQPGIESALKEAMETMRTIEPPDAFESQHEVLVRFIEEQYVTALDITAANAAGDYPRVLDLFGLSRSNERRAREALSAEYLQIAGPLFGPG